MKPRPAQPGARHEPALDGLRGIAIALIVLLHSDWLLNGQVRWLNGGFLGVDIFFVLSGFLITSLLLAEFQRCGSISLRDFWIRRLLRLLPAFLVVSLAAWAVIVVMAEPSRKPVELWALASSALYINNWVVATGDFWGGEPPMMGHTWSLSLEMQFYLVWPVVVLGILTGAARRTGRSSSRRGVLFVFLAALVLALGSLLWRQALWLGGMGWWRVYGGTDAHSDALFIGAAVACAQALGWVSRAGRWVGAAGAVTVGLVVAVSTVGQGVVRWGFVTVAIGTALIIVGVVAGDPIRRPLSWRPLAYLGKISYGLYLWHLPVFTAAVWFVGGPLPLGWVALLAAVSVGVASASYHFVERPALRLKRKYERVREGPLLGGDESQRTSPQHHRAAAGRQR